MSNLIRGVQQTKSTNGVFAGLSRVTLAHANLFNRTPVVNQSIRFLASKKGSDDKSTAAKFTKYTPSKGVNVETVNKATRANEELIKVATRAVGNKTSVDKTAEKIDASKTKPDAILKTDSPPQSGSVLVDKKKTLVDKKDNLIDKTVADATLKDSTFLKHVLKADLPEELSIKDLEKSYNEAVKEADKMILHEEDFVKIPDHDDVLCRRIRTRNNCEIYFISPSDLKNVNSDQVTKYIEHVKPDGIALSTCIKRFRLFYNAKHRQQSSISDYTSDFLEYGVAQLMLRSFHQLIYGDDRFKCAADSDYLKLFEPGFEYLQKNDIPVKFADLQFKIVMNDIFFIRSRHIANTFNYYLSTMTEKNSVWNIITTDFQFYNIFFLFRVSKMIHEIRRFSTFLRTNEKFVNSDSNVPKIVVICEEPFAQYMSMNWHAFFRPNKLESRQSLTYMVLLKSRFIFSFFFVFSIAKLFMAFVTAISGFSIF